MKNTDKKSTPVAAKVLAAVLAGLMIFSAAAVLISALMA